MSLMIRSGSFSATRTIASAPRRAVSTSKPSSLSVSETASRRPGSSSTTNNRSRIAPPSLLAGAGEALGPRPPPGQIQRERGPAPELGVDRDAAAHLLHHVAGEVEPETD